MKLGIVRILVPSLIIAIALFLLFFSGNEKFYCNETQKNADNCIQLYEPVCGYVQVDCITTPCEPVPETYSNNCFACLNSRLEYYVEGECNEKS